MHNPPLQQLARGLYFAPFPALTLDAADRVVDYNLALEILAGDDLNGHRHLPLDSLMQRLARRIANGDLIPRGAGSECVVELGDLGTARLTASEVLCRESERGEMVGRVISWAVAIPGGEEKFHEQYRKVLNHQLTWDTYAWSYDRILTLMPYYQQAIGRHLAALTAAARGPIIDIGAGTGNLVEHLLAENRSITAVDDSRAMLDKLRSKPKLAAAVAAGRLTVIEASAEALPMLADGSFVGASFLLSLFDMLAPEQALDAAVRLLRPGGVIAITELRREFRLDPILEECERHLRKLGRFDELASDLNRVVRSNRDLAPGSRSRLRAEDVYDVLSARGFQELCLVDSHFGQCGTVTGRKS